MHDYFFVGFQEVDDMTEEKIQDELKAIKEAHAADEGNFYYFMFLCLSVCHICFLLEKTIKLKSFA
jgi:transcription initiation factor IIE alpha subunit